MLALVNQSAAVQEDQYSQRVATTALHAVVPAWLAAGKELAELWAVVVAALDTVPAHRRLSLLTALLVATPQVCV